MAFKEYKFGAWKKEIRTLLRKRLEIKDKIRYHLNKIELNREKIKSLVNKEMPETEKELKDYLDRAGN